MMTYRIGGKMLDPSDYKFDGEGGLRPLVMEQAWSVFDTECGDPGILTDLDTPEDYERVLKEGKPPPREGGSSAGC
jgi:CTP:molybdopterin cytidylyltransferase MocA